MSTLSKEETAKIAKLLERMHLPKGLGNTESACSIASINLALTGKLTDSIPACMSEVVGSWIICIQDAMPDEMRNSLGWKSALPFAAGTGDEKEKERLKIILDWMWDVVLPEMQTMACQLGMGAAWAKMIDERTVDSIEEVYKKTGSYHAETAMSNLHEIAANKRRSDTVVAVDAARVAAYLSREDPILWKRIDPVAVLNKLIDA